MRIRAACHVHSDWSYDGEWTLPEIAAAFSRRGYQVVLITEHDQGFDEARRLAHREACRQASTERILLVPGIEYSDGSNTLHFLVWNNVPFIGSGLAADEILTAAQKSGGTAVFAHPSRRDAWKLFKPNWTEKLVGIELWNRKTDGWAPSRDAQMLLNAASALPFVGLDFHNWRQFFPLATLLELEPPITEKSIVASLRLRSTSSTAFGLPLGRFASGVGATTVRIAEKFRSKAARLYRKIAPH